MEQYVKDMYNSMDNIVRVTFGLPAAQNTSGDRLGVVSGGGGGTGQVRRCCGGKGRAGDMWGCYTGSSCRNLIRIGGISAAAAVGMAAYGAHVIAADEWRIDERRKRAFENGSKHHLIQSVGLLLSHKARFPIITAALFASGIILFCGPCYSYGIWNDERFRRITPIGGALFILGWLSFAL